MKQSGKYDLIAMDYEAAVRLVNRTAYMYKYKEKLRSFSLLRDHRQNLILIRYVVASLTLVWAASERRLI